MTEQSAERKDLLRIGISSCLLGEPVRFDGGHKRDRFLTDRLGAFVEWVPVCPELEAGMGVPRPAMRLVGKGDKPRLIEVESERDRTREMRQFSARRVRALRSLRLCGYVLKKDSPSCGAFRVRVYAEKGAPQRTGVGLYAAALARAYPLLPIEEEGRLNDSALRENFIERVFAYRRMRALFQPRWTPSQVVAFHTAHKLQLLGHAPALYRELGRLVADLGHTTRADFRRRYEEIFMSALRRVATRGRNANVLQHAAGHLKKRLASSCRTELAEVIHDYRRGLIPLVVPVTLLRHHARAQAVDYLQGQTFLQPHPKELMLRNHV